MNALLRILLVEDSEDDAMLMIRHIQRGGCEASHQRVQTAAEMESALVGQKWDIVLSDYDLPKFNGRDALKLLQKIASDIPLIIVSGAIGEETAVELVKAGAYDYVMKNNLVRLFPAVQRALREAEEQQKRKQAEAELQASEIRYRSMVEEIAAITYILSLDAIAPLPTLLYVSPQVVGVLGFSLEEWQASADLWSTRLHPEDRDRVLAEVNAFRKQKGPFNVEYRILAKDGRVVWLCDTATIIYNRENVPIAMRGVAYDVTRRKEAELRLQETNRRLDQALADLTRSQQQLIRQECLQALGQMASGIAHDFNNALTPILGFAELLIQFPDYLGDREKALRYLTLIHKAAQDATTVVRRLRDFYRQRDHDEIFHYFCGGKMVENAIQLTSPRWKDQAMAIGMTIAIEKKLEKILPIYGNENDVQSAVVNLLINAVDAILAKKSANHGTSPTNTITVTLHEAKGQILLEVTDTGIGMPPEVLKHCFEPFFTTKKEHGTGLGLASIYGIMQRHQGSVEIESAVGKGSTFRLHFPITAVKSEPQAETAATLPQASLPALRVLVTDDDAMIRDLLAEYLATDGHIVELAASGEAAIEKCRQTAFDLVLLDKSMPGMGGEKAAQTIKQIHPQTSVLLLTGFGDIMNMTGEKPSGVDLILSKPVTLQTLQNAMQTLWKR